MNPIPPPPPPYRVVIAGSRGINDYAALEAAVRASGFYIVEVVSGAARGVDQLGERWATQHGVPVKRFPAHWDTLGQVAGRIRNSQMAEYADALIALWDRCSPGTAHMIEAMQYRGKPFHVAYHL